MVSPVSLPEISERIKELVGDLLDIDPNDIEDSDRLLDTNIEEDSLGLDSLESVQLALAIANEYEIYEPVDIEWERVQTVKDLSLYVCEILSTRGNGIPR
jgi:acyl carrier protein